ncbi:type 1 fimbrial protein [Enterobacter roggenkampii]|nr:type 1 fimbrial protein [Enterobacter roggenkampii]
MKSKIIASVLPLFFVAGAYAAAPEVVEGASGTVTFNGLIKESACELDPQSENFTVTLNTVNTSVLKNASDVAGRKDFSIGLKDCDTTVAQNATVIFGGDTANADETALVNTGDATNVGVQILDSGNALVLNGTTESLPQALANGDSTLNFEAQYVALEDGVTAGDVQSVAQFTVNYQ